MPITINGQTGITGPTWTTATRPSSPTQGQFGYNTTTNCLDIYNGSAWTSVPMPSTQGTSGQYLQSAGAGAAPTWATISSASTILDYQSFTSSGTWTKPSGINGNSLVMGYLWGAGGGGSGAAGGGGGGGGGCIQFWYAASDLNATETVTVGTGSGIDSASQGGNTTFKGYTAYGGGGAQGNGGCGGGGGWTSAGGNGPATAGSGGGFLGGAGSNNTNGGTSIYGGGGAPGGASFWGGGGGTASTAAAGGNSYYGGGGGAGQYLSNQGTSVWGGNGGNQNSAGTAPGGGGGRNGAGARGEARIWTIRSTAG